MLPDKDKAGVQTTGKLGELRQRVGEFEILEGGLEWAEETLRESEQKLWLVFESVTDGIVVTDLNGVITDVNQRALQLNGFGSKSDLIGKSAFEIIASNDQERALNDMQQLIAGGDVGIGEYSLVKADGSEYPAEISAGVLKHNSDHPIGFVNAIRDISERKKAEEETKRLLKTIETGREAILITAADGAITYTNEAMNELFGYESGELIGKYPSVLNAGPAPELVMQNIMGTIEKEEYWEGEVHNKRKDGTEFISYARVSALRDKDSKIINFLSTQHDITERKRVEKALRESERRYKAIFDNRLSMVYVHNEQLVFLEANDTALERLGYTRHDLGKVSFQDMLHPEDFPKVLEGFADTWAKGFMEHPVEIRLIAKSGEIICVETFGIPLERGADHYIGLGIARDITERKRAEGALRESEARYRGLVEGALDVIFTISVDGRLTSLNPAFEIITGWPRAEWIGKHFASIVHPDDLPIAEEAFQSGLQGELRQSYEVRILAKSGEYLLAEIKGGPQTESGAVVGVWGMARDITERKKAEEVLREAEERHRAIVEQAAESIVLVDADTGELVDFNDRAHDNLGYTREELSKFKIPDFEVIGSTEEVTGHIEKIAKEGSDLFETKHRTKAGEIRDIEVSSRAIAIGGRTYIQSIWRDITERKRAEKALRESDERYRALMNLGGRLGETIVMLQDTEQGNAVHTFVSGQWPRITGYSRKELLGMPFFDLLHPRYQEASFKRHRRKMGGEIMPGLFEMSIVRKDGVEVPVELTSAYTTYRGQRANVAFIRDITERKRAEEREKQLQQELALSSRLASIGELAAGVAHEINNPLTGVLAFSERLLRKSTDEETSRDLARIHNEALRAAKVVENLLTFARRREPKKGYLDLNEVLDRTLELRAYELRTSNIELEVELAPSLPKIIADFGQIQQVFLNIILNAEQAMTEANGKGKLSVKTQEVRGRIRVSFGDDGPGIPAEHLDRLFDPFFTTRGEKGGTGLGLSACHGIVTEHGGKIYARSRAGKGATFFIELPLTTEDIDESKAAVGKEPV